MKIYVVNELVRLMDHGVEIYNTCHGGFASLDDAIDLKKELFDAAVNDITHYDNKEDTEMLSKVYDDTNCIEIHIDEIEIKGMDSPFYRFCKEEAEYRMKEMVIPNYDEKELNSIPEEDMGKVIENATLSYKESLYDDGDILDYDYMDYIGRRELETAIEDYKESIE